MAAGACTAASFAKETVIHDILALYSIGAFQGLKEV